jgi:aspartyl-tRNA(Asn)/glutamyl-tRNA(Gln) amidotransferase subunit A
MLAALESWPRGSPPKALPDDLSELDLLEAAQAVQSGALSPVELTRSCLDRIGRLDGRLASFITVTAEAAITAARRAEDEVARGRYRGPLHGIPIALKDNIDTAGVRTTAASAVLADRVPTEDADVVERLNAAGAIVLGKLNMHEFALGTTSAISHFGPVHNPWDLERIAGGSSGGSAAAVAACLCFGAVGTDTGGSIRIPAACCGIVGLKPTNGLISLRGTIPVSVSFDCLGPMCRTVADTGLMFRAMTSRGLATRYDPSAPPSVKQFRIGMLRAQGGLCDDIPVEPEIQMAVDTAIEVIRPLVAEVREADLPIPDLGGIIEAEAYGVHASYLTRSPERYDPRTRRTIMEGAGISAAEATHLRQALARHRAAIRDSFGRVDLVVAPTLPTLPLGIREATEPFALHACTFGFSLGGLPSISIPCGFSPSGLPIGLLIGGPPLSEPRILALAQAYEHVTDWHRRRPSL